MKKVLSFVGVGVVAGLVGFGLGWGIRDYRGQIVALRRTAIIQEKDAIIQSLQMAAAQDHALCAQMMTQPVYAPPVYSVPPDQTITYRIEDQSQTPWYLRRTR